MSVENTEHLGDGVYATFDGYGIWLRTNDHRNDPVAYLGPEVVANLVEFFERNRDKSA